MVIRLVLRLGELLQNIKIPVHGLSINGDATHFPTLLLALLHGMNMALALTRLIIRSLVPLCRRRRYPLAYSVARALLFLSTLKSKAGRR